jgi:hypothetical protein
MNWNRPNIFDVPDKHVKIRSFADGGRNTCSPARRFSLKFFVCLSIGLFDGFYRPLLKYGCAPPRSNEFLPQATEGL